MCHHEGRWRIEARHQAPDVMIERRVDGPTDGLHPLRFQPLKRCIEQSPGDVAVIDRLKETEEASIFRVPFDVATIDDRSDAPHRPNPLVGDKIRHLVLVVKGMITKPNQLHLIADQRRDPARIISIDIPELADEVLAGLPVRRWPNLAFRHVNLPRKFPGTEPIDGSHSWAR